MTHEGRKRHAILAAVLLAAVGGPVAVAFAASPAAELLEANRAGMVSSVDGSPSIADVKCPETIGQYEKYEIRFELDADWQNPFDPDDIDVFAMFLLPDGRRVRQTAFYFVPYESANGLTQLSGGAKYRKTGEPCWKVRFAAARPGPHKFYLSARDRRGRTVTSPVRSFSVTSRTAPGFIRVSQSNPKYFEDSADGGLFYGSGTNVAWTRWDEKVGGTPSYEYYFGKAAGQMSSTRVWLCHWSWLEWMPQDKGTMAAGYGGLGYYNQMIAASFDRVFELAEQTGLRVMLTLDDNNEQMRGEAYDSWSSNPYNKANGGVCDDPSNYFETPEVRPWYKKRLRYILARWGYSTSLWALNGWNDYQEPRPAVVSFLKEMHDYVHEAVGSWRPIIYGANFGRTANDVCDYAQGATSLSKPGVEQECYYTRDRKWFRDVLHAQLWNGLAEGLAAVMVWDHVAVEQTGCWPEFRGVLDFVADMPLNQGPWTEADVLVASARMPRGGSLSRVIAASSYGDVPVWGAKAPRNKFVIDPAENNQWLRGHTPTLYGDRAGRRPWRNPPTFVVELPSAGRMIVCVKQIGGGTAALGVTIDGVEAKRVVFRDGPRLLGVDERWVELPLPAGQHAVTLDNVQKGSDWMRLGTCYFTYDVRDATQVVEVRGQSSGDKAFCYVRNATFGQLAQQVLGNQPAPLEDVRIEVGGLKDGSYDVELFDPSENEVVERRSADCSGGKVAVVLDHLLRDVAVKIRRR